MTQVTEDKAAEQGGRSPQLPGYNPTFFCHFVMLCWNYIPFLPFFLLYSHYFSLLYILPATFHVFILLLLSRSLRER